jgi:pyridinium-3,5-biscarboxylic acid mononucleotide sulfurtransferase
MPMHLPFTGQTQAEKERALIAWLRKRGSVLIGFSGGVDSAYLACVALDALGAERVLAVIGRSASYPLEQWTRAREVAAQFGIPVLELDTDEINDPRYAANPANRCYFCKSELWSRLVPVARERGLAVVVDGTNADDGRDHRPGKGAAAEHGVLSPLAELGFTKDEIRALSHDREIPTWSQPSSPCLASRLPYGTEVTPLRLGKIEAAERALRAAGVVGDLRVRYYGETARVELSPAELTRWRTDEGRRTIRAAVAGAGFEMVELDLRGFRSGSLNRTNDLPLVELLGHGAV